MASRFSQTWQVAWTIISSYQVLRLRVFSIVFIVWLLFEYTGRFVSLSRQNSDRRRKFSAKVVDDVLSLCGGTTLCSFFYTWCFLCTCVLQHLKGKSQEERDRKREMERRRAETVPGKRRTEREERGRKKTGTGKETGRRKEETGKTEKGWRKTRRRKKGK